MTAAPRVAIVHDWLTNMGGAEPVVLELHKLYPDAPIFTSVFDAEKMPAFAGLDVRTTYLQKWLPKFLRYKHVLWPVLRARAFRKLDLSEYDLIISSASAEAKAVQKRPDAKHVCYCHTPTRYYWSHYEEFKNEFSFGPLTFLIRPFIPFFVKKMRKLDLASVKGVDQFIANSTVTQQRIKKYYNRDSVVIYPPVDVERFKPSQEYKREGFIVWGRHVPYKRFDLAIQACNELGEKLRVVGSGPDTARLKSLAGPTISFTGRVSDEELVDLAHHAKAFLFPNEEDFGIAAVEALAAGLPVIAYKKGGALDIVQEGKNGLFFEEQKIEALVSAINIFIHELSFNSFNVSETSLYFTNNEFYKRITDFLQSINY
jgi:glycosyltransferase involved in cell wall biosynthesis